MSIVQSLTKLSLWQQYAFSASLLERMLPNYQLFSASYEFGDEKVLRNQLNLIWQKLDKSQKVKLNYEAQLAKLEPLVPDPEMFDSFGVYPALDCTMAMMSLLQAMQDSDEQGAPSVSRLSLNSVNFYVELMISQEADSEVSQAMIDSHPLTQWENETQQELCDVLAASKENKATLDKVRQLVTEEGLSNLGIEVVD